MGRLRIVRMSGVPVDPESLKAYNTEFKQEYDKIAEECAQDMLKFHEQLQALDEVLAKKYSNILTEEVPKSNKAWHALIGKYEAPVMIAQSSENPKELVLVIMDRLLV